MDGKKKNKPVHANHRERMQERVKCSGLESLAEHEALEYMLFFAIPRKDTNELAHRLIQHFGSYCRVLEASEEELCKVDGIGPASARLIASLLGFFRYYTLKKRSKKIALNQPEAVIEYLRPLFLGQQNELFYLIALDDAYMPLRDIRVAEGMPNKVQFDTIKLARDTLATGCTCAIMAHNHPMGLAIASENDFTATCMVIRALGPLGIEVIDHVIIANNDASSMQQTGRMPRYDPLNGNLIY